LRLCFFARKKINLPLRHTQTYFTLIQEKRPADFLFLPKDKSALFFLFDPREKKIVFRRGGREKK
jgi:hypothetical protein